MLKKCANCHRIFDHDSETLCEKCRKSYAELEPEESKRQCECGKFFVPLDNVDHECPSCKKKHFEDLSEHDKMVVYKKVREYLYKYPNTTKVKVSETFGVPLRFLDEWIEHGRIIEIDGTQRNLLK